MAPTAPRLKVKAGSVVVHAGSGDCVHVPLAQENVSLAVQLHLGTVVRVEQDTVVDLDGAHKRPDGDCRGPRETVCPHRGRRGDDDAGCGLALAFAVGEHEDAIVEESNREAGFGVEGGHEAHDTTQLARARYRRPSIPAVMVEECR